MIQLHNGDCSDILRAMPDASVDAVVTDPPYGIGFKYASHDDNLSAWFDLMNAVVPHLRRIARFVVMPSCAVKRLPWWYENHPPEWIIAWYKGSPGHASKIGFNDWEPLVTWGRPKRPMHDYFKSRCGFEDNGHPCPKPIEWADWLVARAADEGMTILDPFMGSGTTGVACVNANRSFIGIEKDPGYFKIAQDRISAAQRDRESQLIPA